MLRSQQCPTCVLGKTCAYAWLFATETYEGREHGGTVNARPHPLVIRPGDPDRRLDGRPERRGDGSGKAGEAWEFSLLVFGRGREFLPYLVRSVQAMGESGVGPWTKRGAGRFALEKIMAGKELAYDAASGMFRSDAPGTEIGMGAPPDEPVGRLRVRLRTPLRLKQENSLQDELPFHVLVRAALRRVSALEAAYGAGAPELDYGGLARRAESVRLAESRLRWRELQRYSNRQRQKVSLSGMCGEALYEGSLTEFMPLLRYAEKVHLGKQTLFGLGQVEVQPL
jgi:hypothetical protein